MNADQLLCILNTDPFEPLIKHPHRACDSSVIHAPKRSLPLNDDEKRVKVVTSEQPLDEFQLAVKNILRYVPKRYHEQLAQEFADELVEFGHIYAYRFMPSHQLNTIAIENIPARSRQAAAIILMILNNLDPLVAQFPHELVTYGGNGQVFSNWIQFRLVLRYLNEMSDEQTLSLYSGHPHGLFPSHKRAPRLIITNGMVIPHYSTNELYDKFFALGVTQYGQMTAGSFSYIGPQGIVHGTTITVMNAGRKYLGTDSLAGKVFVTAGLGGMSGAQAKASVISGCIGVIAEAGLYDFCSPVQFDLASMDRVNEKALIKRHKQGWLDFYSSDLQTIVDWIVQYRAKKTAISLGYLGNVVDLWEHLAGEKELLVELGSDQTSCHNPFNGGYYPVGLTFDEANRLMATDKPQFEKLVRSSLIRQINAIDKLTTKGMKFWDYGNAFLLECHRAGADILAADAKDDKSFKYPSYFQDIMGDIFSMGFGPFRWVCASNRPEDLQLTDEIACSVLHELIVNTDESVRKQYKDNQRWIQEANKHQLVVGSQARILYSDQVGRINIALAFNEAVRKGKLRGPVILSRDHHDVSGTDSPFRETSNIDDGSCYCADMAVHNFVGDSFRGATWTSLHNGGGTGWGRVINGGFGLVLDGSKDADEHAQLMLAFDVSNGVARRSWSGNKFGQQTIAKTMKTTPDIRVTLPEVADEQLLKQLKI